jgi:beta-xylosidase
VNAASVSLSPRVVWGVIAVVVTGFVLLWLVVAVVQPLTQESRCAGIKFGSPGGPNAPAKSRNAPPIGGSGGLSGKVRSALRAPGDAVYCDDFADPFVLRVGNEYYAYSTNTDKSNVPVLTSDGLFGTGRRTEALPKVARWSTPGRVWAPAVLPRPDGFVLYYTTRVSNSDRQCLSRAIAKQPIGPFVDDSRAPLVCPQNGGAIDPYPFVDGKGRAYLLWREYNGLTGIVAQRLASDGMKLVGPPRLVLRADQPWEAGIVEAPALVGHGGRYYLFYSGNDWRTKHYAIGYAVCDSPLGPCTKPARSPWLAAAKSAQGPGSSSVFSDDKKHLWVALHAWVRGKVGYPHGARDLFVVGLGFRGPTPVIT